MKHEQNDSPVTSVSELDFDEVVMKAELPVFIDVSTEWCPPCRVAAPVVAELARRHAGKLLSLIHI